MSLLDDGMRIEITAKADSQKIERLDSEAVVISGCGKSMTANIDPAQIDAKVMQDDYQISATLLSEQMAAFYTQCPLYEETGCVHTAKLYIGADQDYIAEDIAQHNTIDKVIGKALLDGAALSRAFLMVSGRLSSEMVAKAVMHQIPILASRTASTCLGLQIADKFGLTLVGFVRGKGMNLYRHPERIKV
jgi:FdhD protein